MNGLAYLAARYDVYVLSPTGDSVVAMIAGWAGDMTAVPFPNKLYLSGVPGTTIVDCGRHVVVDTLPLIWGTLLCDTAGAKVYCVDISPGVAHVIDARADTLGKTIALGRSPEAMCINYSRNRVYVADFMDNTVSVIRDTSTGIAEVRSVMPERSELLEARPNPFRYATIVRSLQRASADAPLRIYAQTGALVRTLAGRGAWHWDGRDDHGRPVPAGVYVLRCPGKAGATLVVKTERGY